MQDFFRSIVDDLKDDDVSVMADGKGSAEFTSYVDTGCYMLNALISGSLFGGMADNKVLVVAGESSTGKCARGPEKIRLLVTPEIAEKFKQ